jgi:hypothetical protein
VPDVADLLEVVIQRTVSVLEILEHLRVEVLGGNQIQSNDWKQLAHEVLQVGWVVEVEQTQVNVQV